jgi:hypothetical protein
MSFGMMELSVLTCLPCLLVRGGLVCDACAGNGRFSMVYKCRGRLDGWVYAVKCSKHSLTSPLEQETAMREVFALAALQGCPHLVRRALRSLICVLVPTYLPT